MKYILTLFACLLFTLSLKTQDIIVKNDKTEIKSKVIEIDQDVIKYKKIDFQTGPIYSLAMALAPTLIIHQPLLLTGRRLPI